MKLFGSAGKELLYHTGGAWRTGNVVVDKEFKEECRNVAGGIYPSKGMWLYTQTICVSTVNTVFGRDAMRKAVVRPDVVQWECSYTVGVRSAVQCHRLGKVSSTLFVSLSLWCSTVGYSTCNSSRQTCSKWYSQIATIKHGIVVASKLTVQMNDINVCEKG